MAKYIFGYGSLLNPKSRQITFKDLEVYNDVILKDYQRKMNALVEEHLYMNLIPKKDKEVKGVVVKISDKDFINLQKREKGYKPVKINDKLNKDFKDEVVTFITPDINYPDHTILQSYIHTCLAGVDDKERERWLDDTIIENEIVDNT